MPAKPSDKRESEMPDGFFYSCGGLSHIPRRNKGY